MITPVCGQTPIRHVSQFSIFKPNAAFSGVIKSPQNVQKRRFPAARRAQQDSQFTFVQLKINAIQGVDFHVTGVIDFGDALRSEDNISHGSLLLWR